jgi:hypothetical protein
LIRTTGPERDDGGEVIDFRRAVRIPEEEAREIGEAFPGWHVWYSDWSDTWDAYREGGKPYFGPVPDGGRAFMVSAYSASGLVALLENQVRADIAFEFPDWRVRQSPGGWCASGPQGPQSSNGAVVQLTYCLGIGGLLQALRTRCAGQAILHGA